MKVILKQSVKSLGKAGEIVEASNGYARNFLIPRGLAVEVNSKNMNDLKNMIGRLETPEGRVDMILDTDAYNEIDDQFAVAWAALENGNKIDLLSINAAPFFNSRSTSPKDGMEKSYNEIGNILSLIENSGLKYSVKPTSVPYYKGADTYLPDKKTPVVTDASENIVKTVSESKGTVYVVAIGAITNVASAILMKPEIVDNMVVVWLGGHGHDLGWTDEFNMRQDMLATRIVMTSGIPLVQIPCECVASTFAISAPELKEYLIGKNPLADYLANNVLLAQKNAQDVKWARILWDVVAIGWLLNDNSRFMLSRIMPTYTPTDDFKYEIKVDAFDSNYVFWVNRTLLMTDLIDKLIK